MVVDLDLDVERDRRRGDPAVEQAARGVRQARHDERQVGEIGGARISPAGGQRAGLADEQHLLVQQRRDLEAALRQRVVEARHIDLPTDQPFMDIAAEAADEIQEDVGVFGMEALDEGRREDVAGGGGDGEGDDARRVRHAAPDFGPCLLELAEEELAALEQDLPRWGEAHAMAVALEDGRAQLVLELADGAADGGLRDAQHVGTAAVAAAIRHHLEIAQGPDLQEHPRATKRS